MNSKQAQSVLCPPVSTRTGCIGTTGSGKSFLAKQMLKYLMLQSIVILDPKAHFRWPGAKICTTPDDLIRNGDSLRYPALLYRPNTAHLINRESYERVCSWVFRRKNTVLYIDELPAVVSGPLVYPPSLAMIFMQGRELGITVIWCAQRPANIPIFCISEADRIACFQLSMKNDREKVAGCTDTALLKMMSGHEFWWYVRGVDPRPRVLVLGGAKS